VNKSLDNKEKTTVRIAKERKAQEKCKRAIGSLKNMANQKEHRNSMQHAPLLPCGQWKMT
jgi:hypothetical protein